MTKQPEKSKQISYYNVFGTIEWFWINDSTANYENVHISLNVTHYASDPESESESLNLAMANLDEMAKRNNTDGCPFSWVCINVVKVGTIEKQENN